MFRKLIITFVFVATVGVAQNLGPAAFARMGFYARGMGMGNAMVAVTRGNVVGFYNPAVAPFQMESSVNVGYSFLSLDRSLNFVSFTRRFEIGRKLTDEGTYSPPRSVAGVSAGLINSGVSGIVERDNQGIKTGEVSTSENLFFLSLSNSFSKKLTLGITFRFYNYNLYKDVKASSLAFDFGVVYKYSDNLTFAGYVGDLNGMYRWDTNKLYGLAGRTTEDKFPIAKVFGASYYYEKFNLLLSAEVSSLQSDYNILRAGAECNVYDQFYIRAGIDELNISNTDMPAKPTFGFSYSKMIKGWHITFDYAYVLEPYSTGGIHVVGVNIGF